MIRNAKSNRRRFLQGLAAVPVCSAFPASPAVTAYAYVGSSGTRGHDSIQVFRVIGSRWTHVQTLLSHAPAALSLHPNRPVLYAVNQVSMYEGLPQGTLQVFAIDQHSGLLSLVQRQVLSLSGTGPRSLAITPDARYLLVALYAGGAYNLLPIQPDGRLGRVRRIFKVLGCGADAKHQASAHPHSVMFAPGTNVALTSDFGCDRLSTFALSEIGELQRRSEVSVLPGAGPGSMALHPGGSFLYVRHELKPALSCHRYLKAERIISNAFQIIPLASARDNNRSEPGGIAIHSKGRLLYATSAAGITAFAIDPQSGVLSRKQRQGGYTGTLHLSRDHRTLYLIDREKGSISRINLHPGNGEWDDITRVVSLERPVSLDC